MRVWSQRLDGRRRSNTNIPWRNDRVVLSKKTPSFRRSESRAYLMRRPKFRFVGGGGFNAPVENGLRFGRTTPRVTWTPVSRRHQQSSFRRVFKPRTDCTRAYARANTISGFRLWTGTCFIDKKTIEQNLIRRSYRSVLCLVRQLARETITRSKRLSRETGRTNSVSYF